MQIQWSILKYFEPISLHGNRKHPEDQKTVQDIYWRGRIVRITFAILSVGQECDVLVCITHSADIVQ